MSKFTLVDGLFLYPTPVGAYYAVSSNEENKSRKFLRRLLLETETPILNLQSLTELMDESDEQKAVEMLHHCQKLGWVQGVDSLINAPTGTIEQLIPELLISLTENKKVLLSDDQGFYLACNGFPHEVAEELSALSAEISTVHERRSGLLMKNLGLRSHAWAVVDPFGSSQTGFWPIFIGENRFVIIISGVPHFNQADFVSLIWALTFRYAS